MSQVSPPLRRPCASAEAQGRRGFKSSARLLVALALMGGLASSPWWYPEFEPILQRSLESFQQNSAATMPEPTPSTVVCLGYVDAEPGILPLVPSQPGRVSEVLVKENDDVPANAPLLRIESTAAQLRVQEAQAALVEATLHQAQALNDNEQHVRTIANQQALMEVAGYKIAGAMHSLRARQKELEVRSIGRRERDPVLMEEVAALGEQIKELQAMQNVETQKWKSLQSKDLSIALDLAQAQVSRAKARLLQTERVLEEHTLRAPAAGKVYRVLVAPGEVLGTPEQKLALQFCPDGVLMVRAEVDQAYAPHVLVGQAVSIEDDVHIEKNWHGTVKSISKWYTQKRLQALEKFQLKDARTLECIIALESQATPLLIGQRVRVIIQRPVP